MMHRDHAIQDPQHTAECDDCSGARPIPEPLHAGEYTCPLCHFSTTINLFESETVVTCNYCTYTFLL
jgi:hypothetical protein